MLIFLSDDRHVVAAAGTGRGVSSSNAVMRYVRPISGIRHIAIPGTRGGSTVTAMLVAPDTLAIPFECGAGVAKSTATPACPI